MLTLGDLHIGQDAIIRVVGGEGELRHHLLDMGLTPGTEVTLRKTAPMGDPCLLYTSPSPRDRQQSRMPSSA